MTTAGSDGAGPVRGGTTGRTAGVAVGGYWQSMPNPAGGAKAGSCPAACPNAWAPWNCGFSRTTLAAHVMNNAPAIRARIVPIVTM